MPKISYNNINRAKSIHKYENRCFKQHKCILLGHGAKYHNYPHADI
jgi:hypothetical protein